MQFKLKCFSTTIHNSYVKTGPTAGAAPAPACPGAHASPSRGGPRANSSEGKRAAAEWRAPVPPPGSKRAR